MVMNIVTAMLLVALLTTQECSADNMTSQCVTSGTFITITCPVVDFVEGQYEYVTWLLPFDYEYDYTELTGARKIYMTALWSGNERGYDVAEMTCSLTQHHHAVLIVTDSERPVLPIEASLVKGIGDTLDFIWVNPSTTFVDIDDAYYNYSIVVNVTDGYELTESHDVEAHIRTTHMSINMSGYECKRVDVSISLPGNCQDKKIFGSLLITPQEFQENVTSESLFLYDGLWIQVIIRFTPPELCVHQEAYYYLTFVDVVSNEVWSTQPVAIINSTEPIKKTMDSDSTRLQREHNYTLNVTIITEYENISSTTDFNTHPRERPINIGPIELKVLGYNRSEVQIGWFHPPLTSVPSLPYEITVDSINPEYQIDYIPKPFRLDVDPFISIDLSGYECRMVRITVGVLGQENESQSVNATLPSYSIQFAQDVNVETSFYINGSIREAEITFKPPLVCHFQNASYKIMFSGGNKTWYMDDDPVVIIDSELLIKRESETGFTINIEYTVTITVFTDYANISSSKQFKFQPQDPTVNGAGVDSTKSSQDVSASLVGGVVGGGVFMLTVMLLFGFLTGIISVYVLKRRKEKKQRERENSAGKCMVINPIYADSDGYYEELPENITSQQQQQHHYSNAAAAASDPDTTTPPTVPPPRKIDPQEMTLELSESEREAIETKLNGNYPSSSSRNSLSSTNHANHDNTEDCYTVMSPAGTLTMLSRNRHSTTSLGANNPWPMAAETL